MKIAFFTDSYLPKINGVSYAVDTFAQRLSERHRVEIYAPACGGGTRIERSGGVIIRKYRSVELPTYENAQIALPALTTFIRNVERFNPDVIHVHTPGMLGLLGILMAKRMKKPLIGTYHTLISEVLMYASPRLLFDKYLQAIDRAIEGLGIDVKLLRSKTSMVKEEKKETIPQRVVWSVVNRVYGYADIVLCPSEAIKRELLKRGMKTRVEVLSNGLDLKMFPCKKEYGKGKRILHVGRLSYEKNIDVVIKAAADVIRKEPDARLIIVGDGPAAEKLKQLTSDLGISASVEFAGMVKREILSDYYRNCEVFVTASTMETQGLVVLEAMSSGLPVVAVKKYAMAELVRHGHNGYLVKAGDAGGMSMGIIKLLLEPEVQEKMGRESRKMAETHSLSGVIPGLEEIYRQAMHLEKKTWTVNLKTKLETWLS
jgi:glycosyltransferase involved in cell wall biosynthesis